ncbi:MAG: hypothetical protein PHX34_02655 [Candidatus Shapirobacteria bacterium]|nr:hypothetical protein [Candidatus Shapirobacteria bacterium]
MLDTENISNSSFTGQQEGEKIISIVKPHNITRIIGYIKLFCVFALLLIGFISLQKISYVFIIVGVVISVFTLVIGIFICHSLYLKRVVYITDRRIIRFEPSNIFVINSRSLTWDNVLKVKTFSPTFFLRLINIGNVIVHSKTTLTGDNNPNQTLIGNDDIFLKDIYFYKDLGNYIDKILYLHSNDRDKLKDIRPFIVKNKGQRY